MKPSSSAAFKLMMDGSEAFTDLEHRGMRIDTAYLDKQIVKADQKIKELMKVLRTDEVYAVWRKIYGQKTDLGSRQQLGTVLFDHMDMECRYRTKTGKPQTDVKAFEHLDLPFLRRYSNLEKLKKAHGTYLLGIRKEVDPYGFLHPSFLLHWAITYRSTSRNPNFQNQPKRDDRQAKLVRRVFIPRTSDHVLCEIDYGALEFRVLASFWQDEKMIAYASDPDLDIHRDMAAELYMLDTDDVEKTVRFHAKNSYVFARFYGSTYRNCAPNLWARIGQDGLTTKSGASLYEHLRDRGISDLESYTNHVKSVDENMYNRFPGWANDRTSWWNLYLSRGWFPLMTGFVCPGVFSYNSLMNTPVQGPAFHCLLWSLIELNKWLKKYKMKSMLIGQIHDSMVLDLHKDEIDDVLNKAVEISTIQIRQAWDWIKTPFEVEVEVGANWYEIEPWKLQDGKWAA